MMRATLLSLATATLLCTAAFAQDNPIKPGVEPVALRGTLGNDRVQVTLRAKTDGSGGVEGDYFIFGSGWRQILLAGEIEGNDVFLEESENGTDVSGHWDGTMSGDTISGTWQPAGGSESKPFTLKLMPAR